MMEWSGLSFHFNLHTTEEDSSAIFSADVETVCEPSVTQHDPLPPLTGEWNCIWLSIGSESSLFWGGFVYRGLSAEVENHLLVCICETLFSRSTTPSEGNRHFNKVFFTCKASGSVAGRHEDEFMSDHTTRRWASVLGLMEGLDLYCESVWRLYSLWKHREKRWIWGSGRLGQEVLASLWWCLRFNRRTTAAVTDVETHQIIRAGVTFPPRSGRPPTNQL